MAGEHAADVPSSIKELEADISEMQKLLALCNDRLKGELQSYVSATQAQIEQLQNAALDASAAQVLLLGPECVGARRLAVALSSAGAASNVDPGKEDVFGSVETKYYTARLRFRVVDVETDSKVSGGSPQQRFADADGVVLLWDVQQPSTFKAITEYYSSATAGTSDGDRDAVRLCVAVLPSEGASSTVDETILGAAEWCADNGFEHVCCQLTEAALAAARARWLQVDSRGAALLGEDDEDTATRIVEALECHSWPSLTPRTAPPSGGSGAATTSASQQESVSSSNTSAATQEVALSRKAAANQVLVQEDKDAELSVDMMERFTDQIKQVRQMEDTHARQERAMEVAMQMAKTWGLEDDDDD